MTSFTFRHIAILGTLFSLSTAALALDYHTQRLLAMSTKAPLGMPAPDSAAQRAVTITPSTKYVDVERGETVKFTSNGKTFTWLFDTVDTPKFNLAAIAPKEANIQDVTVYLRRSPNESPN